MPTKKQAFTVMWIIIGILFIASVLCLIFLPKWKGIFLAGCGGFLIVNIFISMFFIQNNYKKKN